MRGILQCSEIHSHSQTHCRQYGKILIHILSSHLACRPDDGIQTKKSTWGTCKEYLLLLLNNPPDPDWLKGISPPIALIWIPLPLEEKRTLPSRFRVCSSPSLSPANFDTVHLHTTDSGAAFLSGGDKCAHNPLFTHSPLTQTNQLLNSLTQPCRTPRLAPFHSSCPTMQLLRCLALRGRGQGSHWEKIQFHSLSFYRVLFEMSLNPLFKGGYFFYSRVDFFCSYRNTNSIT